MPSVSVQAIDLTDGVDVTWGGVHHHYTAADIALIPGNLNKKQDKINQWAAEAFEVRYLIAEYEADHRYRADPPVLYDWERIEGDEVVVTLMYIEIHIFDLGPPVNLTIRCSKEPITGDWWL